MQTAIVNTTVEVGQLQLSSNSQSVSNEKNVSLNEQKFSTEKTENSEKRVKSFKELVEEIQNQKTSVQELKEEVSEELKNQNKLSKNDNLLNLLESGKINLKDVKANDLHHKKIKISKTEENLQDLQISKKDFDFLTEPLDNNEQLILQNIIEASSVKENLSNEEILLTSSQEYSVENPTEFLLDFNENTFTGNEKLLSNLKSEKKYSLDKDGKITVTDLRSQIKEVNVESKTKENDFVTSVKFNSDNSAEMTLDFAKTVQQNVTSFSTQSAASSNSNFQAMLTNQIQANASEFVKTGSIVLKDNDVGSIKLILHPESLGNVKIDLEVVDNVISGKIVVASKEAMGAFKDSLDSLKQAFSQSGFETANFDLSFAGQNNSFANFNNQNKEESRYFEFLNTYNDFAIDSNTEEVAFSEKNEIYSKSTINIIA